MVNLLNLWAMTVRLNMLKDFKWKLERIEIEFKTLVNIKDLIK